MAKIITENFRVETTNEFFNSFVSGNDALAADFSNSLSEYNTTEALGLSNTNIADITTFVSDALEETKPENTYYIMASSIDANTTIANTQKEKREFLRKVLFGNKLETRNIKYLFANRPWRANIVYESFDDEKDVELTNMFVTVLDGDFGEGPYKVFKCIRNNRGAESTVAPSTADLDNNNETTLSDGYVWKYMFDVPAGEYLEYSTSTSLPYIANTSVIENAEESVSDIVIETALANQFVDYIVGTANTTTDQIDPITIESVSVANPTENTYRFVIRTAVDARASQDAYVGMYFRIINPGQANAIYDILESNIVPGNPNRLNIIVQSSIDLTTVTPTLTNKQCDIVPKITVTKSTGRQCIAYGELDSSGTLSYVQFVDKGSEYKYAEAELSLPEALLDEAGEAGQTQLRVIVSPRGGHGSDPISEMYMSRIASVTNFFSSNLTATPDTNTYTKVGLVKNPSFFGGAKPTTFDNRLVLTSNADLAAKVSQNDYLEQTVDGETVIGRIHEISYDASTITTTLYIAEYEGAFATTFQVGDAVAKATPDATESEAVTINTVSNKTYVAYSGDLLHFIDFDPIERQADRKEKIKFVFDF